MARLSITQWRIRPRFTLAAMLGLITLVAIPLAYVAQRRTWNVKRKTAYEALVKKQLVYAREVRSRESSNFVWKWWRQLLQEGAAPRITWVGYDGSADRRSKAPVVGDAELKLLAYFPEIESFHFMGPSAVTDSGLRTVARLPNLSRLWLHEMPGVTGAFLEDFGEQNVLKKLDLRLDDLLGESLTSLKRLQSLETLAIESTAKLNKDSLQSVDLPKSIEDLTLVFHHPLPPEPMARWLNTCKLRRLQIRAMPREAAPALASQSRLIRLIIFDSPLLDEDLASLEHCTRLCELWLSAMPIRGEFLSGLAPKSDLNDLKLDNTLLSDAHLGALGKFKYLRELDLSWTPITGEGFAAIDAFQQPHCSVNLVGTEFSDAGKAALCACMEKGEARRFALPSNFKVEDFRYFLRDGRPPDHADLPIEAALGAGAKMKKLYRSYLPGALSDISKDTFKNAPASVMAPVIRLHESALEKLESDQLKHLYLDEIKADHAAARKASNGK